MKTKIRKFLFSCLLLCSVAAFLFVNFGDKLPYAIQRIERVRDSAEAHVILPDVALLRSVWDTGKDLVPRIILRLS
ncbi:MAG: hypothetical protein RI894_1963 [Bacteroidota bacterium]|jgi:hypothetical protein